jgi:hypothetical protein
LLRDTKQQMVREVTQKHRGGRKTARADAVDAREKAVIRNDGKRVRRNSAKKSGEGASKSKSESLKRSR